MYISLASSPAASGVPVASKEPAPDVSDGVTLRHWYEEGVCLTKAKPQESREILGTAIESEDFLDAFVQTAKDTSCFDDESKEPAKLHANATRGAIAEAVLLQDFAAIGVPRRTPFTKIFDESAAPKLVDRWPGQVRARAFLRMGECVVASQPNESFAIFATKVASDDETAAVAKLVPSIQTCMPAGFTMQIVPSMFRSYLAEAAYRVSVEQLAKGGK
jgi:hypothetical protein